MTIHTPDPQHRAFIAYKKALMEEILENLYDGYAEEVDEVAAPVLYTFTSDFGQRAAPTTLEGPSFEDVLSKVAEDTRQLMSAMFKAALSGPDEDASGAYLWTFSGVDFTQVNGTLATGEPRVRTLALVPPDLEGRFQAWLSNSGSTDLRVTDFQKLGNSKKAVAPAVEHVLHFTRAWRPIVDREDIASKFLIIFTDFEYVGCGPIVTEAAD